MSVLKILQDIAEDDFVADFGINVEVSLVEFLAGEMKRYTILFMKKRKKRIARRKRSRRTS